MLLLLPLLEEISQRSNESFVAMLHIVEATSTPPSQDISPIKIVASKTIKEVKTLTYDNGKKLAKYLFIDNLLGSLGYFAHPIAHGKNI